MKRKIYNKIKEWKTTWNGRTALLLDGARRVGKSWIVNEFAQHEYKSRISLDFNNISTDILNIFENHLTDLDTFFSLLSLMTDTPLYPRESVIIFDEVQLYPKARAAIKYLVADGRYDYIETGSLVSINHNVKDIVIPSEEIRLEMHPMDFEEFLWACNKESLYDYIREQYELKKPLEESLHRKTMELFRTYILVGGMPQAVLEYINTKDFLKVEVLKDSIISLYRSDISKYANRQASNVSIVFDSIPSLLSKHEKRIRPSLIKANSKMRTFESAIYWLNESRVVNSCYAVTEPSLGLRLNIDTNKIKLYMADTGLLVSMVFMKENDDENIYKKILKGKLEFNEGMIVENIISQQLVASGFPLYFYSSNSSTNSAERMEIDFLIKKKGVTSRHNIIPIEVKSGTRFGISSINKFENKYKVYLNHPLLFYPGNLKEENGIVYLPLYMSGLL